MLGQADHVSWGVLVGFLGIASLTWFFSTRRKCFVRVFVPRDEWRNVVRHLPPELEWRRAMRWMALLQAIVGVTIWGLIVAFAE